MHGTGQKVNAEVALKISFYGVVCSHGGIQPDPNKISALEQMSAPTSRETLQTFSGLANYTENRRFHWRTACKEAYDKVKDSISSEVTLI